jgi:hypothetical protein
MPTHLKQPDGKGLARQAGEFLDDRFPLEMLDPNRSVD